MNSHLEIRQPEWKLLKQLVSDHRQARFNALIETNASEREWQEYSDIERLETTIEFLIIENDARRI